MEHATRFLNNYIVPTLSAISENTYMSAIRAGMVSIVPLTIIGGFFMVVTYLPFTWGSPTLVPEDISHLPDLTTKLIQPTDAVSIYLKSRLSPETTQLLEQRQNPPSGATAPRQALVNDLNAIIQGPAIFEESRFSSVSLREVTQSVIERNPLGNDLARLNRLLLEDAYPQEMAREITGWDILVNPYRHLLQIPVTATFEMLAIFVCLSIGYDLGRQLKQEPLVSGMIATLVFLMIQINPDDQTLSMDNLGSRGIFTAIIVALVSVRVQKFFTDQNFVIKLPDNVPSVVSDSFLSLSPLFFLMLAFWLIRFVVGVDINTTVQNALQPLVFALNTLPGILVFTLLVTLLWSVGINGDNTMDAIVAAVFLQYLGDNVAAMTQGQPLPYVTAYGFFTTFVNVGGTGATLGLALVMLNSREPGFRKVSRLSLPTQIFQINEPIFYGMPIVLNPIFMMPYILTALILTTCSYLLMNGNIIQKPFVNVPWTTPPIIGHYLVTGGDWKAAVWGAVSIVIAMMIYYPFAKVAERQRLAAEAPVATDEPRNLT